MGRKTEKEEKTSDGRKKDDRGGGHPARNVAERRGRRVPRREALLEKEDVSALPMQQGLQDRESA